MDYKRQGAKEGTHEKERRNYSKECKAEAAALAENGRNQ
jgi:transposase-like protein